MAVTAKDVFEQELEYIARRRAGPHTTLEGLEASKPAIRASLVGLAMSGGGIRSATTMLGILQGLARMRILPMIDYLSTVSGGGYLGSCLSSLLSLNHLGLHAPGHPDQHEFGSRADAAFSTEWERFPFNPDQDMSLPGPQPAQTFGKGQVAHLRTHGSFLVTRQGLLSRDTLRSVGILLMGMSYHLAIVLLGVFILATTYMWNAQLVSPAMNARLRARAVDTVTTPSSITLDPGAPLRQVMKVHASLAPQTFTGRLEQKAAVVIGDTSAALRGSSGRTPFIWAAGAGSFLSVVAFVWVMIRRRPQGPGIAPKIGESQEDAFENSVLRQLTCWFWGGAIGCVVVVRLWVVADPDSLAWLFLPFSVFAGAGFTNVVLLIACATFARPTVQRSVWDRQARSLTGSYKALVTYGAVLSISLAVLPILIYTFAETGPWAALVTIISAGTSRLLILRPGGKDAPKVRMPDGLRHALLAVAVWLFVVSLVLVFTGALVTADLQRWQYGALAAAGAGLFVVLGFVDLNRMSLHYFYRDRLMETYLRTEIADQSQVMRVVHDTMAMPLHSLHGNFNPAVAQGSTAPYQLISCAVNLTSSRDLTRRNRKSGYFLFSKFYCGSEQTGYQPTRSYRRGETQLARAMTISGAATSPAMGYRTFFAQAFVLVLFNARLGFWIENPHSLASLTRHERWMFWPPVLLRELFSRTNERGRLINVSDGGHTGDNVGIYPLLARGCHVVIACDAECDPALSFGSFTEALRQAYIDFGIDVDIDLSMIRPDPNTGMSRSHTAVGRIRYPDPTLPLGWLIYVKSTLTGTEPEPIRNYKAQSPPFPHETTADQFFTDDQFESYRALGDHIAQTTFGDWVGSGDFDRLYRRHAPFSA